MIDRNRSRSILIHTYIYVFATDYHQARNNRFNQSINQPALERERNVYFSIKLSFITVGGDRLTVEPLLSCGPMLECRRIGNPPPGVPPGEEAQDGAMRIFGVISVLSDSRRLGKAFTTRKKLLSGDEGDAPNHQPPNIPPRWDFPSQSNNNMINDMKGDGRENVSFVNSFIFNFIAK